jgi:HD-GYP domain-containing protein (c-di-GMP phosphodiesterase class II)
MTQSSINSQAVEETEAARADRARRQKVITDSRRLLTHLGSLVRQLAVHDKGNAAVEQVLAELERDVFELRRTAPTVVVVFAEGHTFVNGVWVRSTGRAWESSVFLSETLGKLGGRGLRIGQQATADELLRLTELLRESANKAEVEKRLSEDIGIQDIRLIAKPDNQDEDEETERSRFRQIAVEVLEEGMLSLDTPSASFDVFLRRRQRALVFRLVQIAEETPEDLLVLTAVRDVAMSPVAHNLMVAILSIALGRMMDFRRRDLVRLGVCALSHNVGETLVSTEQIESERALTDEERARAQEHPLLGMAHLLEHFGYEIPIVERALASAEHHLSPSGGGYPEIGHSDPHAFARVIAVADVYNTLVSPRPHRGAPFPPDQAMKLVNRRSVKQLDPLFVRQFTRLVGRYPPGSLVELDTSEYALVLGPGRGMRPLVRPRVLLLTDAKGLELGKPVVTDLGERQERRRAWARTIVRTRDPAKLAAPVSRYMLADRDEPAAVRMDIEDEGLARVKQDPTAAHTRRRFAVAGKNESTIRTELSRFGVGVTREEMTGLSEPEE